MTILIPERSTQKARQLLAIAKELGHPVEVVEAQIHPSGYRVPEDVAGEYERRIAAADEAIEDLPAPVSESGVPNTITEEERGHEADAIPGVSGVPQPKKNAGRAAWLKWSQHQPGFTDADEDLGRDELIAKFALSL